MSPASFEQTEARPARGLLYHAPALLLFAALTFVLVFPVVAGAWNGHEIPGWEGDNLFYVRSMWWWKHALLDLRISPFFDPFSYHPVGHPIARSELTVTNTLLGLPITALAGPVVAYNVVILFSFVATAFFTYLWVEHLTGRRTAGLLAGTMVGFLPFRFAHLPGHLPQLTTQWIPLTLYAFERFLDARTARRAAFLGAATALVGLGCWYYGYSLAIVLPIYVVLRTWRNGALWRERAWWAGVAIAAAVAVALMLPFLAQMFALSRGGALTRGLGEMDTWSLNVYDPFLPNLIHHEWGDILLRSLPWHRAYWVEKVHALGYAALVAALAGLIAWRRRKPRVILALAGAWLTAYLVMLGPILYFRDNHVRVPAPRAVAEFVVEHVNQSEEARPIRESLVRDGLIVPLPSFFMYKFVPFTSGMRVMARFGIWVALMTAALAGFGLITLTAAAERRWGPAARGAIPAIFIALVAFESSSRIPMLLVGPRAVDLWLADRPADEVIVEMPVEQAVRPFQNFWTTYHRRRNLFGWNGDSFPPPLVFKRMEILKSFPAPETIDYLRSSGVTWVLMTPDQIPTWDRMEPLVRGTAALRHEHTFGNVRVYRLLQ